MSAMRGKDHHLASNGIEHSDGLLIRAVQVVASQSGLATLSLDWAIRIRVGGIAHRVGRASSLSSDHGLWLVLFCSVAIG